MLTPDQEEYVQIIALFAGLQPQEVNLEELENLYNNPSSPNYKLLKKYVSPRSNNRELYERWSMLQHRSEALFDLPPKYFSYGVHIPSYLKMIKDFPRGHTPHQALMVGALTEDTIYECRSLLNVLFGEGAHLEVVDFEGYDTKNIPQHIATWKFGDALNLQYLDSFDSVHTNYLLAGMADPTSNMFAFDTDRTRLFESAWRCLRPGGRIVMVEGMLDKEYWQDFEQDLTQAGFTNIQISPAKAFAKRRSVFNYRLQPTIQIDPELVVDQVHQETSHLAKAIQATKAF